MDSDGVVSPLPGYFQDLQQEKKKLEYKLDQLRIRKKDIEAKQDAVAKKNLALTQKNDNMKRTVDVAKRKCQETQLHVDKLQKVNDDLQSNIQKIKDNIKNEEKDKEMLVKSYLKKYADLAQCFRDAKKYYVKPVLEEEEEKRRIQCSEKDDQVKSFEETVNTITLQLERALLENNTPSDKRPLLSEWSEFLLDKDNVLELFNEEYNEAIKMEDKLRSTVVGYQEELKQMNMLSLFTLCDNNHNNAALHHHMTQHSISISKKNLYKRNFFFPYQKVFTEFFLDVTTKNMNFLHSTKNCSSTEQPKISKCVGMLSSDESPLNDDVREAKITPALPIPGLDIFEETLALRQIISTNCDDLDLLLEGGLFTQEVTELFGPPSVGKTQFALSVTYQVISRMDANVYYFDSSASFSAERLVEIIQSNTEDSLTQQEMRLLLCKVSCHKVFRVYDLLRKLESLKDELFSHHDAFSSNLKLIVVDSLNLLISPILGGESYYGHVIMSEVSLLLKKIAHDFGISILVINSAVAHYEKDKKRNSVQYFRPSLGKFWSSVPHIRLFLNKSVGDVPFRELHILKHPRLSTDNDMTLLYIDCNGMVSAKK